MHWDGCWIWQESEHVCRNCKQGVTAGAERDRHCIKKFSRILTNKVKCEQASRQALREAVGEAEFLRVVLPDGAELVHAIPRGERFPINFGRDVAAAIAGTPDRYMLLFSCRMQRQALRLP